MVDGLFVRSMGPTATNGSAASPRKVRHAVSIAQRLEALRAPRGSDEVCDALADMAMRLTDDEDRDEFEGLDGPTLIMDYLSRITEEQATLEYAWQTSYLTGETAWEPHAVLESLVFTVVIICHGSIEETIAMQCIELGAIRYLWEVYVTLPKRLEQDLQSILISALRNFSYVPPAPGSFPHEIVLECWRLVSDDTVSDELMDVGAEVLTNLASHNAALVSPTPERLALLVGRFFASEEGDACRRIAVLDLLCNLCVDPALCLLVMYELDDRKPHRYRRHSGAVYFLDLTESQRDPALRQSMEALAHNLSWSDPAGKRVIQKLGLSSYMARFALEPAIN